MNENVHFHMQIIYIEMWFCKVSLSSMESASYKMYYYYRCCYCYYYLIKSAFLAFTFCNLNSKTSKCESWAFSFLYSKISHIKGRKLPTISELPENGKQCFDVASHLQYWQVTTTVNRFSLFLFRSKLLPVFEQWSWEWPTVHVLSPPK